MRNNLLEETRIFKTLPQQGNNKNQSFQDTMDIATEAMDSERTIARMCVRAQ